MAIVKLLLTVLGILCLLMGLLWIGQGMGWVRWPASSFMINESRWITIGLATAAAGVVAILVSLKF